MFLLLIISLAAGLFCGALAGETIALQISESSEWVLYILMLTVGISVGRNRTVLDKIRKTGCKMLVIPVGIIAGSVAGGILCAILLQMAWNDGASIASGLGWYSLSGVLLSELAGPEVGVIAFLSNFLREFLTFLLIPLVTSRLNAYCGIALGAATSEDTTLPVLIKYVSEEVIVFSVVNGVLCSALVPVLIRIFQIFS